VIFAGWRGIFEIFLDVELRGWSLGRFRQKIDELVEG
jgi:hypothetical protein